MTPNELLHAAAERARELDTAATKGPWRVEVIPPYTDPVVLADRGDQFEVVGTVDLEEPDRAYVVAARSVLGPLADLLDGIATYNEPRGYECGDEVLAVARSLLGPEADRG